MYNMTVKQIYEYNILLLGLSGLVNIDLIRDHRPGQILHDGRAEYSEKNLYGLLVFLLVFHKNHLEPPQALPPQAKHFTTKFFTG